MDHVFEKSGGCGGLTFFALLDIAADIVYNNIKY
jgi:hypothetical protein